MEFLYYGTDTVVAFVAPIGTFLDVDKHTFLTIGITAVEKSLDNIFSDKIKFLSSSTASLGGGSISHEILELIQQLLEVIPQSRYSILLILVVWLIHST
jgi:hypothetical protein